MPIAHAPTIGRVTSNVASAPEAPDRSPDRARSRRRSSRSGPPSRFSIGTRTPSSTSSAVCDARIPSLSSFLPIAKPGVPFSTTNDAWPRWPSVGSTVATTTLTSAMPPFEMKTFAPSRIQSAPSRFAVVRSELTSDPALASVTA